MASFTESRPKLIRLTTVDVSLNMLLRGQLNFLNPYFEIVGVAADSGLLEQVARREGIRTVAVPMCREISLAADLKSLIRLIALFRRERPFIVHANTPKASLLAMIAGWVTRVPHRIYMVTGLRFETASGIFRFVLKTMERITCFCATKVIPEGEGVKETLYREHITRKSLQKIHNGNINGIDCVYFDRKPEVLEQARQLRIAETDFVFVFVGRLVHDKGIDELVAAFDRLAAEFQTVGLLLVGQFEDGLDPLLPETKRIIGRNNKIVSVGYQHDVRPYLAASDALVLPSYREGFPNVVLQAGAMGLPSIVTNINGCNEIIVEGKNGTIIPPRDSRAMYLAMRHYVTDRKTVADMAECARGMIVSRYRQQDVWAATLEMYNDLL